MAKVGSYAWEGKDTTLRSLHKAAEDEIAEALAELSDTELDSLAHRVHVEIMDRAVDRDSTRFPVGG